MSRGRLPSPAWHIRKPLLLADGPCSGAEVLAAESQTRLLRVWYFQLAPILAGPLWGDVCPLWGDVCPLGRDLVRAWVAPTPGVSCPRPSLQLVPVPLVNFSSVRYSPGVLQGQS